MKKLIAYYLPQFHEINENNEWWGKGFTEWTLVKSATPYVHGQKIRKPTTLGYYNLLEDKEIYDKQFKLAQQNGVHGFCLWTYWFGGGEKILEKPLEILKENTTVNYCIAWANHSWYNKTKNILLKEQKYLGKKDYEDFFYYMLPHFKKNNYIKVDNKPVVTIFNPSQIPDLDVFIHTWLELAASNNLDGIYFVAEHTQPNSNYINYFDAYFDSGIINQPIGLIERIINKLVRHKKITILGPVVFDFKQRFEHMFESKSLDKKHIPFILTGWDTTVRHKKLGIYHKNFDMKNFKNHVENAIKFNSENELIIVKSWNEWAEGNILEPDNIFDDQLLKIIKEANT